MLLTPNLRDLTPGRNAFHVHEKPECGAEEKDGVRIAGLASGGDLYLEVDGKKYDYHLGDLPDIVVEADGTAKEPIIAPRLTLADLLNRSIVVHTGESNESDLQACGVIN